MEKILIDCSLTGGRGPAKKVYELCTDLKQDQIPYYLLTDTGFAPKLRDLGLEPDYIVDVKLNTPPRTIMKKFHDTVKQIEYGFMVKIGARMAGPYASKKLGKPYIIVDGGLPDYMTEEEGLYNKNTYQKAEKYYVTTQFNWTPPKRLELDNVDVCCYPISKKTFEYIDNLKRNSKLENLALIKDKLVGKLPNNEEDLLVDLVITGDYVQHINRVSYGAWLTARQYDMVVGYLRRFITDLGETHEKTFVFMDSDLLKVVSDLEKKYSNVSFLTFRWDWDYTVELVMKAASDITVSRATNYQPYIAALEKGCNITTPVPAEGYMDEDSAAIQYSDQGYTRLIAYDDEQYMAKFNEFLDDKNQHKAIKENLRNNRFIKEKNLNKIIKTRASQ